MLNDAVKKGGVMASSHVGGLSGAFIPVSEDAGMIEAVECGALTLEKLEAMTAVCSVGLDMIAVPGDTSASTISGIIGLAVGACLGFTLLTFIVDEGIERLDNPDMPDAFRGMPATLVYIGILALALMGFTSDFSLI
jgi:Na+-transporting NADH:ubiquinone oxidoreductase subunit NqrE